MRQIDQCGSRRQDAVRRQCGGDLGVRVEADDAYAPACKPAGHVAAHAAEADDADIHEVVLSM